MRPDDRRNRPGAEPQAARRARVLPGTDGMFILDHGICLADRTPEEPGVWCLSNLRAAVSFTMETTTNDCN